MSSACNALNPEKVMRHSESTPPHSTALARPARIQSAAMPSALPPDEHAVDTVSRGP